MPKSIVPSPAAAVAVDRLTLHSTDARATDRGTVPLGATCVCVPSYDYFSEE